MDISDIRNHSSLPTWQVARWFHPRFLAEHVDQAVVLPDVCPAGLMPNGTMVVVRRTWLDVFRFGEAIGDIGCAMSLGAIDTPWSDLRPAWNELHRRLVATGKTVLGSGNHFIDACMDDAGGLHVLVHVGCRMGTEDKRDFHFARDYQRWMDRSEANHDEIWRIVRTVLGGKGEPTHLAHDTVELDGAWMVLRKGVTRSKGGEPFLIASSFDDVITFGKAKQSISDLGDSMSHGTGRRNARGEAKAVAVDEFELRGRIIIPDELDGRSWRLEAPVHYRHSSEVVPLVQEHLETTARLVPVAFMGGF